MDFIELVLDSTKEYEAPRKFYYWGALAAISAVLKDSVWFDMGKAYNLYPNIYVLLYGPSGVRKGPAISLAERIVKKVDNTRVIDGRSSIEAIIKELGTFQTREGRPMLKDSCAFVVASELASSIIGNPATMDIMTNLYDRIYNEDEWKYRLKVGESHKLMKPTITWLSGSNEALFRDFVPEKNIHGGLIGRMYMISESRPGRPNALMRAPKKIPDLVEMTTALKPASLLKGPYEMCDEMRDYIESWYHGFKDKIEPELKDETGFVSRILDFIIKNAMIISAGRRADMHIRKEDLDESFNITLPLVVPTKSISNSLKKNDVSEVSKRGLILTYITSKEGMTCSRQEILMNLALQINHEDLDKTIDLLLQTEVVEMTRPAGNVHYRLRIENEKVKKWLEGYRK